MKLAIVFGCVVFLSGCTSMRYSLRELREYDQAIDLADSRGIDTSEMHKKFVEMVKSYAEFPGVDGYERAAAGATGAMQAQAITGLMQAMQPPPSAPPMSFGQWRDGGGF